MNIDFEKELYLFNFQEPDRELTNIKHETSLIVKAFEQMLKKLRKEQNEFNYQVEEIITMLEEIKSYDKTVTDLRASLQATEEEKQALVKNYIAVLDYFEDYYKYIKKHADKTWVEQFFTLWDNVAKTLQLQGIKRIEGKNTRFDPRLNEAKMTTNYDNLPEGIITEVLKCGYIYKSNILRKAEVVVNKKENEE